MFFTMYIRLNYFLFSYYIDHNNQTTTWEDPRQGNRGYNLPPPSNGVYPSQQQPPQQGYVGYYQPPQQSYGDYSQSSQQSYGGSSQQQPPPPQASQTAQKGGFNLSNGMKIAGGLAAVGLVGFGIKEIVDHEENENDRISRLEREEREDRYNGKHLHRKKKCQEK